jgi:ribosomal protein L37AE/L43A
VKASELTALQQQVKPCPFCSRTATLAPMRGTTGWWRVRCDFHDCGGTTWAIQGAEDAVNVWNRRPAGETP